MLSHELNVHINDVSYPFTRSKLEQWCDHFAAALLMPREWVLADIKWPEVSDLLPEILKLPSIYNVSPQALRLRIAKISPMSIFVVVSNDDKISVVEAYQSKNTSKLGVSRALNAIKTQLHQQATRGSFVEPSSDLHCLYRTILRIPRCQKWLICFLPSNNRLSYQPCGNYGEPG